ncbi:hypothetical protein EVAR_13343_1 [Eumeta japonica]|uniref:Uncharacterized protein n=1 Tax=Eumeta variegata TaxID=151549 RepID=A0A4C1TRV7_EUMVA|nr:hypothetical protein EVAR_13343_1 [Eumeta japonica]
MSNQVSANDMDVDIAQATSPNASSVLSQLAQGPATTSTQVLTNRVSPRLSAKPAAPTMAKSPPPPIFLRKSVKKLLQTSHVDTLTLLRPFA